MSPLRRRVAPGSVASSRTRPLAALAVALTAAFPLAAQTLTLHPADGLIHDPLSVRVSGLPAGKPFVVRAEATDAEGRLWQAWGGYFADGSGTADLDSQNPARGSFRLAGAEGLLTSMDLAGEAHGRSRFAWRCASPLTVRLTLEVDRTAAATATAIRRFRPANGTALKATEGGLSGTLFLPAGAGPFPGVLVLGGSEGGRPAAMAAALSARGFAALALAYFGEPGHPSSLESIPLEYFGRGVDWLQQHPSVRPGGIALLGTSKGAEAALLVASATSVRGVVAYAPTSVAWSCICPQAGEPSWTRQGRPVAFIPPRSDPTYAPPPKFPLEPIVHYSYRLERSSGETEAASIPVEKIQGPIWLVAGEDDRLWPSSESARRLAARLARHGRSERLRTFSYPGAGHLIGLPNVPTGGTLVGGRLETGGSTAGNAQASRDSWPRVIAGLRAMFL